MGKKIIACVDGSASTSSVLVSAAWLSTELRIPLLILHVLDQKTHPKSYDLSGSIGFGSRENLLQELAELDAKRNKLALANGRQLLEEAKEKVLTMCDQSVETLQRHGELSETLLDFAEQTRMLVIGKSGHRTQKSVTEIGSHVESIVRTVQRPVMVVQKELAAPQQVMIAYDGSPTSQKVLSLAASSPLMTGRKCHIVMVGGKDQSILDDASQQMKKAGVEVVAAMLDGEVDESLFSYARQNKVDLLVMGAYGHSRVRQFFIGSNTEKILFHSDIPLLFLR